MEGAFNIQMRAQMLTSALGGRPLRVPLNKLKLTKAWL